MVGAFRGTPNGKSKRAERMRRQGTRLPCMLPRGQKYVDNKIQFVHVDDVARLIAHIVRREPEAKRLTILNVAGRGEPMTFGQCVDMAKAKLIHLTCGEDKVASTFDFRPMASSPFPSYLIAPPSA